MADATAWDLLSSEPKEPKGVLNDKIIMRFDRFLNWDLLSKNYDFDVELLRIYMHKVNWGLLLIRTKFDEVTLREFAPNFSKDCWDIVSVKQVLSESFIHDYADKVDWDSIALHQKVSGKFLSDHLSYSMRETDDMDMVAE